MFLQRAIFKENTQSKRLQAASLIFNVEIPESLHATHLAAF